MRYQLRYDLRARRCALEVGGRPVWRVPVAVRVSGLDGGAPWQRDWTLEVLARSVPEAGRYAKALIAATGPAYPVEIEAYGPQGGPRGYYIGWESAIGAAMLLAREEGPAQLELPLKESLKE